MKIIKYSIFALIAIIIVYGIYLDIVRVQAIYDYNMHNFFVSNNGWLSVNKTKLVNERKKEIQLRGVSTFYVGKYFNMYNVDNIKELKDEWGVNVLRVAMLTDPQYDGYIKYRSNKEYLKKVVDMAIANDLYVIIDWHILNDGDPMTYIEEADEFFNEISEHYKDTPNVIYEICNEPNGDVTWKDNIKPYAERIIKTIRKNSPKSVIVVGTNKWCQDLDAVMEDPLAEENIMYALHFYAASHGVQLRNTAQRFIDNGYPIFVTECGMTFASGDGGTSPDKFREWISFLDKNNISWVYWKFGNKGEESDIVNPKYYLTKEKYCRIDDYLTYSGKEIKQIFLEYKKR